MNSTTASSVLTQVDENSVQSMKMDNGKSVEVVLERLESLKTGSQEVNPSYTFPEGARPDIAYDSFDFELPVIDLSPVTRLESLQKEIDQSAANDQSPGSKASIQEEINKCEVAKCRLLEDIRAAAEKYGFLQIINHGISMDLVEEILQSSRPLFDLPLEEKQKFEISGLEASGFRPFKRAHSSPGKLNLWSEAFGLRMPETYNPGRTDHILSSLLPEESAHAGEGQQLKSSAEIYGEKAGKLAVQLLDMMAASLGVQDTKRTFLGCEAEEQIEGLLRINHYPVCAQPELTWGARAHADPFVLTVLHQGQVSGLQIEFKDGSWHGVRPISGALVVNVGDYLQAMTNGRFESVQHRVVVNREVERYSIVYFLDCARNHVISPSPELVDAEHPIQFKPFTKSDYFRPPQEAGPHRQPLERFVLKNSA